MIAATVVELCIDTLIDGLEIKLLAHCGIGFMGNAVRNGRKGLIASKANLLRLASL